MKRVIFCEGESDNIFLRELLPVKIPVAEDKILFFDQNSSDFVIDMKHAQTRCFDKFGDEWRRYEILAKSEGGKDKIVTVVHSELINLCKQRQDPILLIDLDETPIGNFITKLTDVLISGFKNIQLNINQKLVSDDTETEMWLMELRSYGNLIGKIYVIAFKTSLEVVTGIKKTHSDDEKKELIKAYIRRSKIHLKFLEALNN